MATQPKRRIRYSIHLATESIESLDDFLTDNARSSCVEIPSRSPISFPCKLLYRPAGASTPDWAKLLDQTFAVDGAIKSSAALAVILFQCEQRVMASTYGFGHVLLDADRRENDFGLLIAANALSDENVKLVEKANLGSVIRDAAQSAGITRFQEFNVDRALSLVRRLSGSSESVGSSLSGATSITVTSEFEPAQLVELGKVLLKLYKSDAYKKTGFGIIDKIKPVHNVGTLNKLETELLTDINTVAPSFELGLPEIETKPTGFVTITGTKKRNLFADLNLATALNEIGGAASIQSLIDHKIVTHNVDGTGKLKEWSIYRGLVGSIALDGRRYALNEGRWYRIDDALINAAKATFAACSKGLDTTFPPWPIIGSGKNKHVYEKEGDYNVRACGADASLLLFDKHLFPVPTFPGPGIEICDIFDVAQKRLIHVKRSGRRSSVISHFLNQGLNSAKLLRTYEGMKAKFFAELGKLVDATTLAALETSFPYDWSVEFKFGDFPNSAGEYTIPFFSRVALDEAKREIEALGFQSVLISFIRLSKPPTA